MRWGWQPGYWVCWCGWREGNRREGDMSNIGAPKRIIVVEPEPAKVPVKEPKPVKEPAR